MDKHTKEPWVLWNKGDGVIMDGCSSPKRGGIALMCCNDLVSGRSATANARRIVACVNACAGLPTEQLESPPLGGVLNGVAGLIAQRDELLAALEGLLADMHLRARLDGDVDSDGCVVINCGNGVLYAANAAIAKAKGV